MRWMEIPLMTVLAAGAAAEARPSADRAQCPLATAQSPQTARTDGLLFHRYAEGRAAGQLQRVTLRVFDGDTLVLTEELAALPQADADADAVVELLSRQPDTLTRLERLNAERPLRAELEHAGSVRRFTWTELRATSREIASGRFLPQPVSSAVRFAGEPADGPQRIPCDDCYVNYDYCVEGCEGEPICIKRCRRALNTCLTNCTGGGCVPTTQTVVEDQIASSVFVDTQCWYIQWADWPGGGKNRDRYYVTVKYTKKRITRNCDGTQTVEILDVWYVSDQCVGVNSSWSCSLSNPWDGCTF